MNAFQQRYNRLIQRINNPKQRTQLDILEFQAMRGQVDALKYAQDAQKLQETIEPNQEQKKEWGLKLYII